MINLLISPAADELAIARRDHAAWFDQFEDAAIGFGDPAEAYRIRNTAPTELLRDLVDRLIGRSPQ